LTSIPTLLCRESTWELCSETQYLWLTICFFHNRGQTLQITASGELTETIEEGAKVNLVVKWGLITLISQTVELCDQIKEVDMECPLEKGPMTLKKEVKLPSVIPPVSNTRGLDSQ
jgi:trehalose/maltose hydrolase-like predicted phosphorylase